MEPVGLAFATLGVAQSLVQAYKTAATIVTAIKDFSEESAEFAVKLQSERVITIRLRDLLFARKPANEGISLFDNMDGLTQQSLHASFEQFARTIAVYLPLERQYHLSLHDVSEAGHPLLSQQMFELIPTQAVRPAWQSNEQSINGFDKLKWAFRHRKRAFQLLKEIEAWNKRITRLVQQYFLEQMWLTQTQRHLPPKNDEDVRNLGIGDAIDACSVANTTSALAWPDESDNVRVEDCELKWHQMPEAIKSGTVRIARLQEKLIIIDPKSDDRSPATERRVKAKQRLDQLATVLRLLHRSEANIAQCLGWVDSVDSATFSLIFELSKGFLGTTTSLLDYLPSKHVTTGPSLEERFQTAFQLGTTILKLHSVSWLHKNIRSENICFLHSSLQPASPTPPAFEKWYLFGFEYSRHTDQKSSLIADSDIEHNIYRHPARWGVPTAEFNPIHEIYAFGVILLELGLWRKVKSLDTNGFRNASSPFRVTEYLITRAKTNLPFLAGSAFTEIVVRCLEGDLQLVSEQSRYKTVLQAFSSLIVDELRILAFPRLVAARDMAVSDTSVDN